jgi:CrcB protein
MTPIAKFLVVGLGGFAGANLRYWLGGWMQARTGATFPWQTMAVNLLGSVAIGLFMVIALREGWSAGWRLFVAVGVLGGFTTFSTFSYEAVTMLTERSYGPALLYVAGSALICVAGAWGGLAVGRMVLGG